MAGHNKTLGGGGFHHIAWRAYDFDKSVKFYKEAMGFTEKVAWGEGDARGVLLDTGDGNYVEIFAGGKTGPKPEGAIWHFAIRTDNVDKAIERARVAGLEVTVEPKDHVFQSTNGIPPVPIRIAFFKGPDGEIVEFFQNELT